MKEKNMITAKRIKQCRLSADETLEQIGQLVGVHKTTVRRWETGETERIALPTIQKLAIHYNVSPAWLIGADVPMNRIDNEDRTEIDLSSIKSP
jgi:repressor LexA